MIRRTLTESDAKNPGIVAETITALWGALTALEKSCSDSHAPSNPSSHGPSAPGGASPSSPSSSSSGAAGATGSSDSARRALADNNRPAWLTREAASTLPEGVERIYGDGWGFAAFPGAHWYDPGDEEWMIGGANPESRNIVDAVYPVYHLPPAAKGEGDAKPDAGRAEGRVQYAAKNCCGYYYSGYNRPGSDAEAAWFDTADTPAKWAGTDGRVVTRTVPTPATKPSPGEVAEDDYTRWVQYRDSFKHAPTRVRPTERDLFNSFALTLRERSPLGH